MARPCRDAVRRPLHKKGSGGSLAGTGGSNVAAPFPFPAPVKGWMTAANITAMPQDSAYLMDNWFPETDNVRVRRGSLLSATLPTANPVNTVMVFQGGATQNIFAAQGAYVYDVSAGGTITVPAISGLTSDIFCSLMFAGATQQYLYIVNGTNTPRYFDGTSWTAATITGATSTTFNYVWAYNGALYFCQNGSSDVAYLPATNLAGAAAIISLGGELSLGGAIIAGSTLSVNSGYGLINYQAFISSEGEVVIYSGTNPGTSDWALKGVFRINRPIGNRCLIRIGADVAVLCSDGLASLTKAMALDLGASIEGAFTANIALAFSRQYNLTGSAFGWQIISYPTSHMAIINIPTLTVPSSIQYVMNVVTGAWSRYTGMNLTAFALASKIMYAGTSDGKIVIFERGNSDQGVTVSAPMIGAWSNFKAPNQQKHVKNMQVYFSGSGSYLIGLNAAVDFMPVSYPQATAPVIAPGTALWDTAIWDTAIWPVDNPTNMYRLGVSAIGEFIAPVVIVQTSDDGTNSDTNVNLFQLSMLQERGAVIG